MAELNEPEPTTEPWEIFVSYATEDHDHARAVYEACERRRVRCFFDLVALGEPRSVSAALSDHLARSRALILVWSRSSAHSLWVELELSPFLLRAEPDRRIIVLTVDDEPIPEHFANTKIRHLVDGTERAVDRALCPATVFLNYDPANPAAATLCDTLEKHGHIVDRLHENTDPKTWEQFDRPLIIYPSKSDKNAPSAWQKHFDHNRSPNNILVINPDRLTTPPILARAHHLHDGDPPAVLEWLKIPERPRLLDALRAPSEFWETIAKQLPSRPSANFGFAHLFLAAPGAVEELGNGYAIGLFIGVLIAGCFGLPHMMLERSLGARQAAVAALILAVAIVCAILPFFPNVAQKTELAASLAASIALAYFLVRSCRR